jgi:hypothetical protein
LGDLPHGWVASDFVRSFLDLLAYEDRAGEALVLAAGVPAGWLERPEGVGVADLRTPWGPLGYRLTRYPWGVRYRLDAGGAEPPGGLVFAWPLAGRPAAARADGEPVPLSADGTLTLRRRPAVVDLFAEAGSEEMP